MNRVVLYSMIDKENSSYNLYDKNNNIVKRYINNDIFYQDKDLLWVVKYDSEKERFYLHRFDKDKLTNVLIMPIRINLSWANDDESYKETPFKYLENYSNVLEKWVIFHGKLKRIIKYEPNIEKRNKFGDYVISTRDNIVTGIRIYTNNKRIYKIIVKDLNNRGVI